jgi:hypothetical protein
MSYCLVFLKKLREEKVKVIFTTKGRLCPCFLGTFLILTNSLITINFLKDKIEFFKLRHPIVGIDIFSNLFIL